MPTERTCPGCGYEYAASEPYCTHCARPAIFRNVEHAAEPAEQAALGARYHSAVADAGTRGVRGIVEDFEERVLTSKAVIARPYREAERLAASPNEVYATFYQLVSAGARVNGHGESGADSKIVDVAMLTVR